MTEPGPLLELEAGRAVRWLALLRLDEAKAAHARLASGTEAEALHDLRVALRRLRVTLSAYRESLGSSVRRRDRRRLRRLVRATGRARDAEVQLAWLRERARRARGPERAGIAWTRARLAARLRVVEADAGESDALDAFPRRARRLERALRRWRCRLDPRDPQGEPPFRVAAAAAVRAATDRLARALAAAGETDGGEEIHRARIAAKRLRYLLEPLCGAAPGASGAVAALREMQDALGSLRDLHLLRDDTRSALADEGASPGGEALLARMTGECDARRRDVQRDWLGCAADPLLLRVRELADALAGAPDREIERKYLLRGRPALDGLPVERLRLDQGYLPGERLAERVRRVRGAEGTRFFRTVKLGSGISRIEIEEECGESVFRGLWRLTRGRRVRKVRYRVRAGERVWEVDRFLDRPLLLAEVELPDADAAVTLPEWLAPFVEREVTGEPEYVNLNLAR